MFFQTKNILKKRRKKHEQKNSRTSPLRDWLDKHAFLIIMLLILSVPATHPQIYISQFDIYIFSH
jgi:hypothetical protein